MNALDITGLLDQAKVTKPEHRRKAEAVILKLNHPSKTVADRINQTEADCRETIRTGRLPEDPDRREAVLFMIRAARTLHAARRRNG